MTSRWREGYDYLIPCDIYCFNSKVKVDIYSQTALSCQVVDCKNDIKVDYLEEYCPDTFTGKYKECYLKIP